MTKRPENLDFPFKKVLCKRLTACAVVKRRAPELFDRMKVDAIAPVKMDATVRTTAKLVDLFVAATLERIMEQCRTKSKSMIYNRN
jgi:hypothetical protein